MLTSARRTVSVVMCTYNGAQFLSKQLDSIISQTYPVFEIYIQDDCSTDNTLLILKEYSKGYHNIHFLVNAKRLGINENFFTAFSNVHGDFIAVSDQDDIWCPEKIEKEMSVIGDNLLCFCRSKPFSDDSSVTYMDLRTPNFGLERLIFVNVVAGHTMLFNKKLLKMSPKGYNTLGLYDSLLAFSAALYERVCIYDSFLVYYRRHNNNATGAKLHDYSLNIYNLMKILFSSFWLFLKYREVVKSHYQKLFKYICDHDQEKIHIPECHKKVVQLLANSSFISLCKVSSWCLQNRRKIFYSDNDNFFIRCRALLFPILMYQYWDYLYDSILKSD